MFQITSLFIKLWNLLLQICFIVLYEKNWKDLYGTGGVTCKVICRKRREGEKVKRIRHPWCRRRCHAQDTGHNPRITPGTHSLLGVGETAQQFSLRPGIEPGCEPSVITTTPRSTPHEHKLRSFCSGISLTQQWQSECEVLIPASYNPKNHSWQHMGLYQAWRYVLLTCLFAYTVTSPGTSC